MLKDAIIAAFVLSFVFQVNCFLPLPAGKSRWCFILHLSLTHTMTEKIL